MPDYPVSGHMYIHVGGTHWYVIHCDLPQDAFGVNDEQTSERDTSRQVHVTLCEPASGCGLPKRESRVLQQDSIVLGDLLGDVGEKWYF